MGLLLGPQNSVNPAFSSIPPYINIGKQRTTLYFCVGEQKAREACDVHIGSKIGNAQRELIYSSREQVGVGFFSAACILAAFDHCSNSALCLIELAATAA